MKSLISIRDFSKEEILHVLETAREFEQNRVQNFLEGKVIASLFFEPSTRTRLSFETAINRLGAKVIGFSDASNTSQSKGETLKDTIKMVNNYVDMIVMRHPLEGSSRYASEVATVPVVNAGDGANQHPSQTLLDLYSILQTQGTLEGLTINMVGDLKYGRTTHSLLQAMSHFNPKFIFTAPEELKMPKEYKDFLDRRGIEYIETTSLNEHLNDCDILYMTRVQQERFTDLMEYERVKDVYTLNASMLGNVRDNMKILHPLPRVTEIDQDVDDTKYAYYFKQALCPHGHHQLSIGISLIQKIMSHKELVVSALENGTVLDHIPAENVYKALDILNLKGIESQITIGINLTSKFFGKKGIIKIADKFFEDEELNKLALIAPKATVNVIRDFKVVEKKKLVMPEEIHGIAKCRNPKCVTNNQPVKTWFKTIDNGNEISLLCHYCEKITDSKHIF